MIKEKTAKIRGKMSTQTFLQKLEECLESDRQPKVELNSLAAVVSNELRERMPLISPELFERRRRAQIALSTKQLKKINEFYKEVVKNSFKSEKKYVCSAEIPTFSYAIVPEQTEVVYPGAAKIALEETFAFDTTKSNKSTELCFHPGAYCSSDCIECEWVGVYQENARLGSAIVQINSTWTAPFTLDVLAKVPDVPAEMSEIGDEALLAYYELAKARKSKSKPSLSQKPRLGILWSPTEEVLYCNGDVPKPLTKDPALVLEIPDGKEKYCHVIAMWDIKDERPFKNWLAEYTTRQK